MPGSDERIEGLIGRLYDAAAGLEDWRDVLASIADLFGGSAAVIGVVGPHCPGRAVQAGVDPALMARYLERHAGRNELAARSASLPVGSVVTDGSLMRKDEFLRTAFYDECLRPQGLRSLICLRAARGERGAVANVCVLRSAREGEFGAEEVELLSRLAPHLRRAVAVHTRLAEAEGDRRALAEALERLPRAAFVVDGAAVVRHANAAGAALLAARDGGLRADPGDGGALRAARPEETALLRRLVAAAVPGRGADPPAAGGHACLPRPPPRPPLVATAVPLSASGIAASGSAAAGLPPVPMALLLVADPGARPEAPPPALLREAFGLTKAEATVAARAAVGEGVPGLAASLAISEGTARLHLHRVFEKTGARRQAELAAVLARLAS
jgi:DNA-binding CsgD family transcriptional regulator/GAF domain-containing protein